MFPITPKAQRGDRGNCTHVNLLCRQTPSYSTRSPRWWASATASPECRWVAVGHYDLCGYRDSNPELLLGRQSRFRYAIPACAPSFQRVRSLWYAQIGRAETDILVSTAGLSELRRRSYRCVSQRHRLRLDRTTHTRDLNRTCTDDLPFRRGTLCLLSYEVIVAVAGFAPTIFSL